MRIAKRAAWAAIPVAFFENFGDATNWNPLNPGWIKFITGAPTQGQLGMRTRGQVCRSRRATGRHRGRGGRVRSWSRLARLLLLSSLTLVVCTSYEQTDERRVRTR
jgi:hypothetical protein